MGMRILFAAVVLAIAVAGISVAAKGGGSNDVTLCAAKKDGALSLATKGKCGKGERKLVVAKEGPAGATGPQGAPGPAGASGSIASIQPEAVHLVAPTPGPASFDCGSSPATFCTAQGFFWGNFGEGFAPAGFQKDAAGYVHLQGAVAVYERGVSGGANERRVFVLPPDYRPTAQRGFVVPCGTGYYAVAVELDVSSDGAVRVDSQACEFGAPIALDGVSFHP